MKTLLLILISLNSFSQDSLITTKRTTPSHYMDSVAVKVLHSKKIGDSVHYILKINGEKVASVCCCKQRKKGEIVMVAKSDLLFYKKETH